MGDGQGPQWSNDAIDGWEEPHTQLVVFYDGWLSFTMVVISLLIDGCIMYVISFIYLLHLYHGFNEDDVSLLLHMYILLSLSYPVTCTVDD